MNFASRFRATAAALCVALATALAQAAAAQPQPAPPAPPIEAPRDAAMPGVIRLDVDATDLAHAVYSVRESVPVARPGPITLLYPKWLPGNHSPTGPIDKLAGLTITAGGAPLAWRRDPVDVYAFHVEAPPGASSLELTFQFLSAVSTREGRIMMTPDLLSLQWNTVLLYPAGWFSRGITVEPSVTVPTGFTAATALTSAPTSPGARGDTIAFAPTTLNTLVDSPLIAGRNFTRFDLDPGGPARVSLDVIADRPEDLAAKDDEIGAHKALVRQAYKLFDSRHYDHYDFLFSLSDKLGGIGLEHHQSSEDGEAPKYFLNWDKTPAGRDLLAHEFTHSWNGKFRRPADLWTPTFNTPMRDTLLWVYEGQTQYWGFVLAARSGLLSKQQTLDAIAATAAVYDHRAGRAWRDLEDTTNDPIIALRRPLSWLSWQRSEDYYSEGELIWLDVDTLIRERTDGRRSLDDFARAFFGVDDGSFVTRTYDFDEVVAALNAVTPYDWAGFLHARLSGHGPGAPLDGLARGGYRLIYSEVESPYLESGEAARKVTDFAFSLGLTVGREGVLSDVLWDGPAFKAGLTAGTQIVAVNGQAYTPELLKDTIRGSRRAGGPINLLVRDNDTFRTVAIEYHEGLRYPHLEPIPGAKPRLDAILAAR